MFADGGVISLLTNDNEKESKKLLQLINENIEKIPTNELYSISGDGIVNGTKSKYISDIFDIQNGFAFRNDLGKIELSKSGAESTIFHGFGKNKLIASKGIKNVIENGTIIAKSENYKNKGYTRYVIAGYGKINKFNSVMAVAINEYLNENGRKSFYLHEIMIKNKDVSPFMAEQKETVSAGKTSSTTNIPNNSPNVNPKTENNQNISSDTQYSKQNDLEYMQYDKPITVEDIKVLRSIGRKSINDFTSEDIQKSQKWAYKFYQQLGTKSPFFRAWFGDWRAHDTSKVELVDKKSDYRGNTINRDTGWNIIISRKISKETSHHRASNEKNAVKFLPYIEDITKKAVYGYSETSNSENVNSLFYHIFYAYTEALGFPTLLKLKIEELYNEKDNSSIKRDYILQNIEEGLISESKRLSTPHQSETNPSTISISDLFNLVKQYDNKFSLKEVNPLLLNEDGTPKVFYHGTRDNFTVFELQDKQKFGRVLGDGFYFTPDYDKAFKFANGLFSKGQDRGGLIMPTYLKISNPYVIEPNSDRTKWRKEYTNGNYDGIIDLKNNTYFVETSSQIKSATDNIGTFDENSSDIRYSKSTDIEYNELVDKYGAIEQVVMMELRNMARFLKNDEVAFAELLAQKTNKELQKEKKRNEDELFNFVFSTVSRKSRTTQNAFSRFVS